MTSELSIPVIADAIEKNGWPQIKELFIKYKNPFDYDSPIIGACALGQAALNLGRSAGLIFTYLDHNYGLVACPSKTHKLPVYYKLGNMVTHLNDEHEWKLSSIARWLRKQA